MARLLGVQLGGTNYYQGVVSQRATLGEPLEVLQVKHITATVHLMHGAWLLFMLLSVVVIAGNLRFIQVLGIAADNHPQRLACSSQIVLGKRLDHCMGSLG